MAAEADSPKREPTPSAPLSSIPQKRALEENHSPAVSSPLNPDGRPSEPLPPDDSAPNRSKSARTKKDSFKKREAKGSESARATPEPKSHAQKETEPDHTEASPLRYKLAPPKLADFEPPRGPFLTPHHKTVNQHGEETEFFETADQ